MKCTPIILSLLISVILVSGCISQSETGSNKGLTISLKASPPEIFTLYDTSLQVDIENLGARTFRNVRVWLYDIGNMYYPYNYSKREVAPLALPEKGTADYCTEKIAQGYGKCQLGEGDCDVLLNSLEDSQCAAGLECRTLGSSIWEKAKNWLSKPDLCCDPAITDKSCFEFYLNWKNNPYVSEREVDPKGFASCAYANEVIRPNEFESYICRLKSPPSIIGDRETEYIRTKATFDTEFSLPVIASIMSEQEYQRQKTIGNLPSTPQSFSANDGNIQIDVKFSSEMPIVDRLGKEEYMYIEITNIGNGYLDEIRPQDISIHDTSTQGKTAPEEQNKNGFLDMIFGSGSGRIIDATSDMIEGNFLDKTKQTLGINQWGYGETGCFFDFHCKGDLECKSASYLTPSDNICCHANENAVMENNAVVCKTIAEQNPYVVNVATPILSAGNCDIDYQTTPLKPIGDGRHFPRITCKVQLPNNIPFLTNHVVIVTVAYRYELRQEVPVTILK